MSLEQKIKALLEKKKEALTEQLTLPASNMGGEKTPVPQGSSQQPEVDELDQDAPGKDVAAKASQEVPPQMQGDATSVKVQSMEGTEVTVNVEQLDEALTRKHFQMVADAVKEVSDHNMRLKLAAQHIAVFKKANPRFDEARFRKAANAEPVAGVNEEVTVDLKSEVAGLFEGNEALSEEFVTKATAVFEAAVIARVNAEVMTVTQKLEEKAESELTALKSTLSEQVDQYVGYVVENWLKENQVAIDAGLRSEVAEDFMTGLKNLFAENYIEVPEDKVDVLKQVSEELSLTKETMDKMLAENAALKAEKIALEKAAVIESVAKDMAATDAERLKQLIEGVEFDSKELFAEKVAVIKEAHFKKAAVKSAEALLESEVGGGNGSTETVVVDPTIQSYVKALQTSTGFTK